MKKLMKGKAQETVRVNIHNDVANAAFWFKNIIANKLKDGGPGIMMDCMACAVMLAFTWEAYLNYFGCEVIDDWDDMAALEEKEDRVLGTLGIQADWGKQPYSSVRALTKVRNWLAHGKPLEKTSTKVVVIGVEKVVRRDIDLSGKWQGLCTPAILLRAHDDLDAIFRQMLQASGIALIDTLSSGDGHISYDEVVEVGKK
ncbi:hypothetical protein JQ616_17725 [Bradyrhizobium tropiciagri]|uniref:hypothetical protein n=1 Tax=Bradyrhizobium tropiciagri TaxID=312253 RepID=UPI001BA833E3|nr:hypothetical protein [Bradyrhizobium tropiciagri]MBR0896804.1 hypothetical protein [Bradyrhizobium tropiciagri]